MSWSWKNNSVCAPSYPVPAPESSALCSTADSAQPYKVRHHQQGDGRFLKHFGRSPALSPTMMCNAEHYLVKVLRRGSDVTNISDLRAEVFYFSKCSAPLTCLQPAWASCLISSMGSIMPTPPCTPWKATWTLKLLS